nr:dihydroxy-acid dehydratase [Actinomadura madurae]
MAAATVNLPAIVLSGGPMLNGYHAGMRTGSGLVIWRSKRLLAAGEIDYDEYMRRVCASAPSIGHCNTMGTALSMNSVAEALGMALPGCAAIPAPYRERAQMAYDTGRRAAALVREDATPRKIMTWPAFENAIAVASAIAASTNVPIHINAIARHAGVELSNRDWQRVGADIPVLANTAPAGSTSARTSTGPGGVPAVMRALLEAGHLHGDAMTVSGRSVAENLADAPPADPAVIRPVDDPVAPHGGLLVMTGNLFESAVMKTSVITDEFRARYLPPPGRPQAFDLRAIVFDGPEDYHARIEDPGLDIDEHCILVIRYTGPIGYPGSAEVVNMELPTGLAQRGVIALPTLGDGGRAAPRTPHPSSTPAPRPRRAAASPSCAPATGSASTWTTRALTSCCPTRRSPRGGPSTCRPALENQTPWQEIYRSTVGQLDGGGCLELAVAYQDIAHTKGIPRDSH